MMLAYNIKLVYKDVNGQRHISVFDVDNEQAAVRILQYLDVKNLELVFMTFSDNVHLNRIQGPKPVATFYDLSALTFLDPPPLADIYRAVLGDYIKSHEVPYEKN